MNFFDFDDDGAGRGGATEDNGEAFGRERLMDGWSADPHPGKDDFAYAESQGDNADNEFFQVSGEMIPIGKSFSNDYTVDINISELPNPDRDQHQQHFPPSSTTSKHQQQEVPTQVPSHSDDIFTSTHQPQHHLQPRDSPHKLDSNQPKQMQSPMPLDMHRQVENHRSMSPLEQQHAIDMLMAKELNQLTFRERNEINEEIHGVASLYSVDETPQLISQSLEQLQFEIDHNVPMHRKVAYERSQQIYKTKLREQGEKEREGIENPCSVLSSSVSGNNSSSKGIDVDSNGSSSNSNRNDVDPKQSNGYVNDPEFLLLFLRRDRFVVRKAAARLANFMELVYELWGEVSLTEKIWQSQAYLDSFEREVLRTGTMQCLQGRDRAGRRILGNFADDNSKLSVENRLRLSMYCVMAVLEDVETQKNGAVAITMWHNVSMDDFQKRGQCHKRISDSLPIRFSAIHFCLPHENQFAATDTNVRRMPNPQLLRLLKAMFVMSIGAELRAHLRVHIGSTVECMYALQSFGILAEQIPVNTTTGKVKTKQHHKWLDLKLQKEKALKENKIFNKIECPMIRDVLFGRGWPIMKHPGNVMLRNIIDSKLEEYQNEKTKRGKTLIAYSVVCMVKQKGRGGRFLKEDSGWWVEVSNDMARQKVSIAFRDARKLKSNQSGGNGNRRTGQDGKSTQETSMLSVCNPSTTKRKEGSVVSEEKYCLQENDSSTSAFLGMDGITGIKRQRCFDKKMLEKQW